MTTTGFLYRTGCVVAWLMLAGACSTPRRTAAMAADGYESLLDNKTLDGWVCDPVYWRLENGVLVGEVTPATLLKRNSFIIKKDFIIADFDLTVDYRISSQGNSGINYRSETIDSLPFAMRGYQADIDGKNKYTGQNYEERKRTTLAYRGQKTVIENTGDTASLTAGIKNNAWIKTRVTDTLGNMDALKAYIHDGDWNHYHLVVKGNRLLHYINDILMSDVTDNDTVNRKFSGSFGVQVHVGPPMKVEFRNFRIKKL